MMWTYLTKELESSSGKYDPTVGIFIFTRVLSSIKVPVPEFSHFLTYVYIEMFYLGAPIENFRQI